jgi:DNA-binding beta-propeller fold protein YncE
MFVAVLVDPPSSTAVALNARAYVPSPVSRGNGSLLVIEGTQEVASPFVLGSHPVDVAVTPLGTKVFVADDVDNTVTVVDPVAGGPGTPIADPALDAPSFLAMAPDGNQLYISNLGKNTVSFFDTTRDTGSRRPGNREAHLCSGE